MDASLWRTRWHEAREVAPIDTENEFGCRVCDEREDRGGQELAVSSHTSPCNLVEGSRFAMCNAPLLKMPMCSKLAFLAYLVSKAVR